MEPVSPTDLLLGPVRSHRENLLLMNVDHLGTAYIADPPEDDTLCGSSQTMLQRR